jgi:hypothetical protein
MSGREGTNRVCILMRGYGRQAAQPPLQPTRRNRDDFGTGSNPSVIPIYQRHPAGG